MFKAPLCPKRGRLSRLRSLGLNPGELAIAWDDPTSPSVVIGDRGGVPRPIGAVGEGSKDTLPARSQVVITTALLAPNTTSHLIADLGRTYALLAMSTDFPARVRIYVNATYREADAGRTVKQLPEDDHGLVAEVVTTESFLSMRFAPIALGGNQDSTPEASSYLSVTNTDVVPRAITVTFTRLAMEI